MANEVKAAVVGGAFIIMAALIAAASTDHWFSTSSHGTSRPSPTPTRTITTPPQPPGPDTPGNAQIASVVPAGNSSCHGDTVEATITVSTLPSPDRQLWLMAIVMTGTPSHPVYYAKRQLTNTVSPQTVTIQFIGAAIDSVRNLVAVSSPPASFNWLKMNLANDGNPKWDGHRVKLPSDVAEISRLHKYEVTQQC